MTHAGPATDRSWNTLGTANAAGTRQEQHSASTAGLAGAADAAAVAARHACMHACSTACMKPEAGTPDAKQPLVTTLLSKGSSNSK